MTTPTIGRPDPDAIRWDADGLVPVVAQAITDHRVLMLGYADREAFNATIGTGELHFHSRSRARLWRKGESSGHVLRVHELRLDCDGDALLALVDPVGPTCHRGTQSCFDTEGKVRARLGEGANPANSDGRAEAGFAWLEVLWATISDRLERKPADSYTAGLVARGVDAVARKVAEEGLEVALAAKNDDTSGPPPSGSTDGRSGSAERKALTGEVADLLYHVLVLLAERGLAPALVIEVLRGRHNPASPPAP